MRLVRLEGVAALPSDDTTAFLRSLHECAPHFVPFSRANAIGHPLQSPPTANIQEYWFSFVLFANFYDYSRNNYRNDFPKFPPPFPVCTRHTRTYLAKINTRYNIIVFNGCLEEPSVKLATSWMKVQTARSVSHTHYC